MTVRGNMSKVKDAIVSETPSGLEAVENLYEYAIGLGLDGILRVPGVLEAVERSRQEPAATVKTVPVLSSDLFTMRMEDLRAFAVRIGLKGARHIQGGKAVLAARVNELLATMSPDDPRLVGGENLLAGVETEPAKFNVDLSTTDKNLARLLTLLETLPEEILQAEFKYGRQWGDGTLPHGWSDMDQLRYNMRFYPFHRKVLAERPNLPVPVLVCLKQDPHPEVRKAAASR